MTSLGRLELVDSARKSNRALPRTTLAGHESCAATQSAHRIQRSGPSGPEGICWSGPKTKGPHSAASSLDGDSDPRARLRRGGAPAVSASWRPIPWYSEHSRWSCRGASGPGPGRPRPHVFPIDPAPIRAIWSAGEAFRRCTAASRLRTPFPFTQLPVTQCVPSITIDSARSAARSSRERGAGGWDLEGLRGLSEFRGAPRRLG